jgi:hypothetical protein
LRGDIVLLVVIKNPTQGVGPIIMLDDLFLLQESTLSLIL